MKIAQWSVHREDETDFHIDIEFEDGQSYRYHVPYEREAIDKLADLDFLDTEDATPDSYGIKVGAKWREPHKIPDRRTARPAKISLECRVDLVIAQLHAAESLLAQGPGTPHYEAAMDFISEHLRVSQPRPKE
jgi:hypothetical protein